MPKLWNQQLMRNFLTLAKKSINNLCGDWCKFNRDPQKYEHKLLVLKTGIICNNPLITHIYHPVITSDHP